MSTSKISALVIAESANPEWTSVPLVGWSHSTALALAARVHLVTQVRNRDAILRAGREEGRDFTAIDSEAIARPLWKIAGALRGGDNAGWTTLAALAPLAYYYFEHLVWRRFGADLRRGRFDVVHRLTPLSPTTPSTLASKCRALGVPFILGPLNGGLPWPKGFESVRWQEKEWLSYFRAAYKLLPGYRATLRDSAAIIVGSKEVRRQIPERYHSKCFYIPENGFEPARFTARRSKKATKPIRGIFVGRLVPIKAVDIAIEAATPLLRSGDFVLDVVGDGPEKANLALLVQRNGVEEAVRLIGWVDHTKLQDLFAQADLFVFPSIREFGGGAVVEAMAVGLAPIVVDYGGPGEIVTPETGFVIPMSNREGLTRAVRSLLTRLVKTPEEIDATADRARLRAWTEFTWEAKAQKVVEIYESVLAGSLRGCDQV